MRETERDSFNSDFNMADAALFADNATLAKPSMYKVMLLSDDYTPSEFLQNVLQKQFHKPQIEAAQLTMQVRKEGLAVCGFFTRDVAETKVSIVNDQARRNHHPLKCTFEADV
jgi:ATP-dependent Clp protease adaptor protein ClpS